jgi:hypothetical protein
LPGFAAGLAFGFMHLPALAHAFGFGHPGQGFIFFHLLQNRCCIMRSFLLQRVISKGDTQMTTNFTTKEIRAAIAQANNSTPSQLSTKEKAQHAFEILTGSDFIDAEYAVEMATFGLGAMPTVRIVKRALERAAITKAQGRTE